MKQLITRMMRYYGTQVTLVREDADTTLRAFLRPVTSKSVQSMRAVMAEFGQIPDGQYLFLGPADCALDTAQGILCGGKRYLICRAEKLLVGDETVCWWGLLQPGGADDAGTA